MKNEQEPSSFIIHHYSFFMMIIRFPQAVPVSQILRTKPTGEKMGQQGYLGCVSGLDARTPIADNVPRLGSAKN